MIILKAFAFLTKSFTKLDTSSLTNSVSPKSMANTLLLMEESPGRTSQAVQFRTPHFHCREPRVNPWLGTKIQNATAWTKKKASWQKAETSFHAQTATVSWSSSQARSQELAERSQAADDRNGYVETDQ